VFVHSGGLRDVAVQNRLAFPNTDNIRQWRRVLTLESGVVEVIFFAVLVSAKTFNVRKHCRSVRYLTAIGSVQCVAVFEVGVYSCSMTHIDRLASDVKFVVVTVNQLLKHLETSLSFTESLQLNCGREID